MSKPYFVFFSMVMIVMGCRNGTSSEFGSSNKKEMNAEEKMRLKQYLVKGEKLYSIYCANCHQMNGKGLALLYPPLAGSDYLMEDLKRAACIIKNGVSEEMIVNGITFNQMMPPSHITDLEIAELITYISNSWGNQSGLTPVKAVNGWLLKCN